jgi:hypothetical protein
MVESCQLPPHSYRLQLEKFIRSPKNLCGAAKGATIVGPIRFFYVISCYLSGFSEIVGMLRVQSDFICHEEDDCEREVPNEY